MKVFELPKIMILICEVSEKSRMWFLGHLKLELYWRMVSQIMLFALVVVKSNITIKFTFELSFAFEIIAIDAFFL